MFDQVKDIDCPIIVRGISDALRIYHTGSTRYDAKEVYIRRMRTTDNNWRIEGYTDYMEVD